MGCHAEAVPRALVHPPPVRAAAVRPHSEITTSPMPRCRGDASPRDGLRARRLRASPPRRRGPEASPIRWRWPQPRPSLCHHRAALRQPRNTAESDQLAVRAPATCIPVWRLRKVVVGWNVGEAGLPVPPVRGGHRDSRAHRRHGRRPGRAGDSQCARRTAPQAMGEPHRRRPPASTDWSYRSPSEGHVGEQFDYAVRRGIG
jgi:hypothetical protein